VRTLNSAPGHDVVVIARSGVSDANFLEVREALLELLRQTSIIVDDEGAADQT